MVDDDIVCGIQGRLVYVNYGRIEDYQRLINQLGVNVNGCIAIARYGRIFRGDKVSRRVALTQLLMLLYLNSLHMPRCVVNPLTPTVAIWVQPVTCYLLLE